ncbi:oligosaccharide flippase family protein [Paraburkholderia sp.]|jgi:teichuronic acid exporter|uniref:oligosaccharide flippase family protein n=1 Tax=Paraburkholderia sp. TaxID=1926495 RepID=UPI003C79A1F8
MKDLNGSLRRSVSMNVVGRYSNILIQLGVTAVLARSLGPSDFGIMAAVSVLSIFLAFLSEMGLGPAIIQFREINARQMAGLFWLTQIVGAFTGTLFAAAGPLIAHYYHAAIYVGIAKGMGLNLALSCWVIVPLALLRRDQRFAAIAGVEVSAAVISGVAAILAAFGGWGVYALVTKSVVNALGIYVFSLALARPPCRVLPSVSGMRHLFSYSAYQFMFSFVNYFSRNLDKILIGRYLGASMLGLYDMSYRLMLMPVANLTHVITPALQPVYAEYKNDPDLVFLSYRKLFRFLLIVGAFAGLACVASSSEIIGIIYGPIWKSADPIFFILSFSIVTQVVLSSTGSVFQSLGRTDLLFKTGLVSTITMCAAIAIGIVVKDIELLCWLLVISFFINAIQSFHLLMRRGFNRPVSDLLAESAKFIVGALTLFLAASILGRWTVIAAVPVVGLVAKTSLIAVAFGVLLAVTGDLGFVTKIARLRRGGSATRSNVRPNPMLSAEISDRQILVIADRFPVVSETFVIEQIRAFLTSGARVTVLARSQGDAGPVVDLTQTNCSVVITRPSATSRASMLWTISRFLMGSWQTSKKRRAFRAAALAVRSGLAGTAMDIAILSTEGFQFDADLIVAHFGHIGVSASYLQRAGLINGRLATVFHGYDVTITNVVEQYQSHYLKLFRSSDWLLPVSRFFADRLQYWGADPTQIHVCRMGIDARRFAFRPKERTTTDLNVLAVARLTEKKGVQYLVRAMALLPANVTLTVIGTGPLDKPLRALVDELMLGERVQFAGARTHEEVRRYLSDADVFVLPSVTAQNGDMEGVPVVLMEAMATGVSVVSTVHSGIPELIQNEETGLLVPERNHIELAAVLQRVASGEIDVRSMRLKARKFVEENFNVQTEAERLFERVGIA